MKAAGPDSTRGDETLPVSRDEPLKILLVDDHEGVRATTAALLTDLGHHVFEAQEGAVALDMMRRDPEGFDLVLSDYAMPRLSGAELVRQLRAIRPDLPAIIITGYAEPDSALVPAPDVPLLVKPFDSHQLQTSLIQAQGERLVN
jgi:CheY-like chemotaxis protein